jgi:hypothetical protein
MSAKGRAKRKGNSYQAYELTAVLIIDLIYVGFVGPELISAKDSFAVVLGVIIGAAIAWMTWHFYTIWRKSHV